MTLTKLQDLIDPEVIAELVSYELEKQIRFAPLAEIDTTLQGAAGSTLKFATYTYIGDAEEVAEGEPIPLDKLGTEMKDVTISKAGKGAEITDEAVLSDYGDPIGEVVSQLQLSIANKADNDLLAQLRGAVQHSTADFTTVAGLQAGLDVFEDEDDVATVLILNPVDAGKLRIEAAGQFVNGSDLGADRILNGVYGDVLGVQIVRSKKVAQGEAFLVRQGALKLVMKRAAQVESDRDIVRKTTVITADQHYAPFLYDATKVVRFGDDGSGEG